MSLTDFWTSVRNAARLDPTAAIIDAPPLDAERIHELLEGGDRWLNPGAVAGFDRADFNFLSEEEQQALARSVTRFREIAVQVPQKAHASERLVRKAIPEFRNILLILRPDKYIDVDSFVLGKQIERKLTGKLPSWVRGFRFETGTDANGDPAIWIYVEIEDFAAKKDVISENSRALREAVSEALASIRGGRWPYIRLRSASEQKGMGKRKK